MTSDLTPVNREGQWDHKYHREGANDELVTWGKEYHSKPIKDGLLILLPFQDRLTSDEIDLDFIITNTMEQTGQEEWLNEAEDDNSDELKWVTTRIGHISLIEQWNLCTEADLTLFLDQGKAPTEDWSGCLLRVQFELLIVSELPGAFFC